MPEAKEKGTEKLILDAAMKVFTQRGFDGARTEDIAKEAGINRALLHYYYRTKEKLYETVAHAVIGKAVPVIRQMLEGNLHLEENR